MGNDTEYMCEVVQITEILPHLNADKLEIAHFKSKEGPTAYTCVVRKGTFKPGDYADYYGVDCVINLSNIPPGLEFLATMTSKNTFRVKAARLRGVYSEGILVPQTQPFGTELGECYDVVYHSGAALDELNGGDSTLSPKAAKKRKKVFLGPDYSVTSLRKVPRLFEEGEYVRITEKLHGSNFRCGWVRHGFRWQFVVGSHHTIKKPPTSLWGALKNAVGRVFKTAATSHYYGTNVWSEAAREHNLAKKTQQYRNYVFYGELYGHGIQELDYGERRHKIRFFDIYDIEQRRFLLSFERETVLADCELDSVPLIYFGGYSEGYVKKLAEGLSLLPKANHIREGVVVESLETTEWKKGKVVGEGYRLTCK